MHRIISQIDREIQFYGKRDPKIAFELWRKIKDRDFILSNAIKVTELKNGKKCFLAPAICHMILMNPSYIHQDLYRKLALSILRFQDLSRLVVFNKNSFLYLVLVNGTREFDRDSLARINFELHNKRIYEPFSLYLVDYDNIVSGSEKRVFFNDEFFNISLDESELDVFSNGEAFTIRSIDGLEEVDNLLRLVKLKPNLDDSVKNAINDTYDDSMYYRLYNTIDDKLNEESLKL